MFIKPEIKKKKNTQHQKYKRNEQHTGEVKGKVYDITDINNTF